MLKRWQGEIHAERDRKLEQVRQPANCGGAKRMAQAGIRMAAKAPSNRAFRFRRPKE
jgi:hypothetical protein